MHFSKKLNLLPQNYKDRYANKYIMFLFGGIVGVMVLIMIVTYGNYMFLNLNIKRLMTENTEFQNKQTKISTLKDTVNKNTEIISEYQKENFPFYSFMQTIENQKPYGLTIISIDSADRLVSPTIPQETPNKETTPSESQPSSIIYDKDLSKTKLVVRGYSQNPSDVAQFVNTLSQLSYVDDVELKAIEEHTIDGLNTANIFEAILKLK